MKIYTYIIVAMLAVMFAGCAQSDDIFGDVGENISSPSSMTIDTTSNRLYLVNSNDRVRYDWHQGSFQILDISNPLAPSLVKSVVTRSFGGEIYHDVANLKAYVPNRFSEDTQATEDTLYNFSLDESSTDTLLSYTTTAAGRNSYAIQCCYPARRAWITTSLNELQYVDLDAGLTPQGMSLLTTLSDESVIAGAAAYHLVIRDNQAFVSREGGGLMVMNLDKAGASGTAPMDYFIPDLNSPRGLAIDGNTLYIVNGGDEGEGWNNYLIILDVTSLTPLTDNIVTTKIDKDDAGLVLAKVVVGANPAEVVLSTNYAFVSNEDANTVSVVDRAAMSKVSDISVGNDPFSLALYSTLTDGDKYVYVGNLKDNTISIIDIASLSVVATYP